MSGRRGDEEICKSKIHLVVERHLLSMAPVAQSFSHFFENSTCKDPVAVPRAIRGFWPSRLCGYSRLSAGG